MLDTSSRIDYKSDDDLIGIFSLKAEGNDSVSIEEIIMLHDRIEVLLD